MLQNAEEALPKPLGNGSESHQPSKNKLKKHVSDVSMDSIGYPLLLKTPEAVTPEKVDKAKAGTQQTLAKEVQHRPAHGRCEGKPRAEGRTFWWQGLKQTFFQRNLLHL